MRTSTLFNKCNTLLIILTLTSACDCTGGDGALHRSNPKIEVNPTELTFDFVPIGARVAGQLTITNTGDWALDVEGFSFSDGTSDEFSLEADMEKNFQLMPMASKSITVFLTPKTMQAKNGVLIIASTDPERPKLEVPLISTRRQGPALSVCTESESIPQNLTCGVPGRIDFGSVPLNEKRTASVILISSGTDPVQLQSANLLSGSNGAFKVYAPLAETTLEPGTQKKIEIEYNAGSRDLHNGEFVISSNDPQHRTAKIQLQGRGNDIGLCLMPSSVDFGFVPEGQTAMKSVKATNCGQTEFQITGAEITQRGMEFGFPTGPMFPVTLPPNPNFAYEIQVKYTPTDDQEDSGTLKVVTDRGTGRVSLVGGSAECDLAALPGAITFQGSPGGILMTEDAKTLLIENIGGGPCSVTELALTPQTSVEVAIDELTAPALPHAIQPGESMLVNVLYSASPSSLASGALEVHSNDPIEPVITVPISQTTSTGGTCLLEAKPQTVNFGAVLLNQTKTQGLEIGNLGDTCNITRIELASGANPAFRIEPHNLLGGLAGYEAKTLPLSFAPTTAGQAQAIVEIEVSNPNVPVLRVPLTAVSDSEGICVNPRHLPFGERSNTAVLSFQIYACGSRDISINALTWSKPDAEMNIINPPRMPLTLAAGENLEVSIQYAPTDTDGDTGILTVESDDPLEPNIEVQVTGGREIVPASAGRYLYYWQIATDGDIMRIPLQGELQKEPYWGPQTGKECSGCHNLSPDGRYLAMTLFDSGTATALNNNPTLTVVDTRTQQTALTTTPVEDATYMSWNPNVETTPPYQYVYAKGGDLHIAALYHGYIGVLQGASDPNESETMPSWGPNGKIAFVKGGNSQGNGFGIGGAADLYMVDETGGTAEMVAGASQNSAANYYPTFSPNGQWIAFTYSASAQSTISALDAEVRLVKADNSGLVMPLTQANGTDGASSYPTWAKDGSHLSFSSNRQGGAGSWDLYLAPIDQTTGTDGPAANITEANSPHFEHAAQWSP